MKKYQNSFQSSQRPFNTFRSATGRAECNPPVTDPVSHSSEIVELRNLKFDLFIFEFHNTRLSVSVLIIKFKFNFIKIFKFNRQLPPSQENSLKFESVNFECCVVSNQLAEQRRKRQVPSRNDGSYANLAQRQSMTTLAVFRHVNEPWRRLAWLSRVSTFRRIQSFRRI